MQARPASRRRQRRPLLTYGLALALVGAVTAVGDAARHDLAPASTALLYLIPVMAISTRAGLGPGLFTGAVSALAYNYFLLPPHYTLRIADPDNVVTLIMLLAVAAITSQLAARLKSSAERAERAARANAEIAGFGRKVAACSDDAAIDALLLAEATRLFECDGALVRVDDERLDIVAAGPHAPAFGELDHAAALWSRAHGAIAGRGADTVSGADWLFAPARGPLVLALARPDAKPPVEPAFVPLLTAIAEHARQASARLRLASERREIESHRDRDALRTALLSSVGHDLRSPLTAILGEIEALRADAPASPALGRIADEARRLDRLIDNLLGMARVEAGEVRVAADTIDLTDAVGAAIDDVRAAFGKRPIVTRVAPDLPLVTADPQLLHHVLVNLLDNARKHADAPAPVVVAARREDGGVAIDVIDEGPSLPPGREEDVFDRFTRLSVSDRTPGTGLGLAIVRGFAAAMGMTASAAARSDRRGAVFTLHFPAGLVVLPEHVGMT